MYILEFNEQRRHFHNNYPNGNCTGFGSELFSNGYKPVCLVPKELCRNEELFDYTEALNKEGKSYEEMVELVSVWIIKKINEIYPEEL